MNESTHCAAPLTLQDKLDRISRDRDLLAQLRDLARQGLRDGDRVLHQDSGASGRVLILRSEPLPRSVVELDDGRQVPFDPGWCAARGR